MKFYDVVYELAGKMGLSIENLSIKLGKGPRYVGGAKSRGSIPSVKNASMILNELGYVLCAIPADEVTDEMLTIDS